jgi:cell division protein FtsL
VNSLYLALGIAVAGVSLASLVFEVGRKFGRLEEHLADQDTELAELHKKLDNLKL